jgi:hypothetical protein
MRLDVLGKLKAICKVRRFHGGDYDNVLFWNIKTLFVSHKKHYVSATESSRLVLCKI